MTPKEQATELIQKMYGNIFDGGQYQEAQEGWYKAKQCALIAVDELIESEPRSPSGVDWDDCGGTHQYYYEAQIDEALSYWQEVKEEINKL